MTRLRTTTSLVAVPLPKLYVFSLLSMVTPVSKR